MNNAGGATLIGPNDPPPFEIVNGDGRSQVVICADHASKVIPESLNGLGLAPEELDRHIAIDIGAADVARRLAVLFDAPAILAGYSRLVIDCNRPLDDHTSVRVISDGTVIPGNRRLSPPQLDARADEFFLPYHRAISDAIEARQIGDRCPVVISVHSYTGEMNGMARPWHLGVLSSWDRRIADPLLEGLQSCGALSIGDNKPYSGRDLYGYSIETHALPSGLPNVLLEFRQDQVDTAAKADAWADRVGAVLQPILDDPSVHVPYTGEREIG